LNSGAHQTRPPPARPNVCAVTRTCARSCSRKPPAASATCGSATELRHQRGHQTVREAV